MHSVFNLITRSVSSTLLVLLMSLCLFAGESVRPSENGFSNNADVKTTDSPYKKYLNGEDGFVLIIVETLIITKLCMLEC